jgi:hypothetical protein
MELASDNYNFYIITRINANVIVSMCLMNDTCLRVRNHTFALLRAADKVAVLLVVPTASSRRSCFDLQDQTTMSCEHLSTTAAG